MQNAHSPLVGIRAVEAQNPRFLPYRIDIRLVGIRAAEAQNPRYLLYRMAIPSRGDSNFRNTESLLFAVQHGDLPMWGLKHRILVGIRAVETQNQRYLLYRMAIPSRGDLSFRSTESSIFTIWNGHCSLWGLKVLKHRILDIYNIEWPFARCGDWSWRSTESLIFTSQNGDLPMWGLEL